MDPAVGQDEVLGMVAEDPRSIPVQDVHHAVDHRLTRRAVGHVAHGAEQGVELRVGIVGGVLPPGLGPALGAVKEEQEVLRVGIVGIPAEEEELGVALADLVLEAVPVRGPHHQLQVDLLELLLQPIHPGLAAQAGGGGVQVDEEGLARGSVPSTGVARFRQQAPRFLHGFALGPPVHPVVHHGVHALPPLPVAEDARRDRPLGGDTAPVGEDGHEFLEIHRDGKGLPQLARPLRIAAHHRVEHVEAHVHVAGGHGGLELDAPFGHLRRDPGLAPGELHRLVEVVGADAGSVVVALQELVPVGDAFLLQGEHHGVDEGQWLARVRQQPFGPVFRAALGGVGLPLEIGVAAQHHAPVGVVLRQHVGAGTHGVPVQGDVLGGEPRLAVEAFGFPGHGREEGHGEPVDELGVFAPHGDAVGIAVHHLGAREGIAFQVEIGPFPPGAGQGLGILRQPHDVLAHQPQDGGMDVGPRQPLDLVHVVGGHQLPGAGLLEVRKGVHPRQLRRGEVEIARLPCPIPGEGRVGLIADAGTDADLIHARGDGGSRGALREEPPGGVVVAGLGHSLGGQGHQGVGPLEVVVLEGRHVDLGGEGRLVLGVGLGRVQVLGTRGEGGIEDVLARIGGGIGVVPRHAVAGREEERRAGGGQEAEWA